MKLKYFAYGSNMDQVQMASRCPKATLRSTAILPNYKFIINSRGVASVVPKTGRKVYGLLWELKEEDERALDKCEGVKFGTYAKEWLDVKISESESITALVYVASNNELGPPRKGYLEKIIVAAQLCNFPRDYIEELQSWASKDDDE